MKPFTFPFISRRLVFAPGAILFSAGGSGNDEVEVRRRRQGTSTGPSGRADAPERRRPGGTSGGSPPPQRPVGGGGSSGGGGGGGMRLPWWAILLLGVAFVLYQLFFSGGQNPEPSTPADNQPSVQEPVFSEPTATRQAAVVRPTRTPVVGNTPAGENSTASGGSTGQTWTVLLYQDADDKILEEDIMFDLNEAERVGSTDRVNIVAQVDRYRGAYSGDGNWTGTRRYYIRKDNDLTKVGSELVDDLGEVDMADGKTLVDFATWAIKTYPADRYALILSDHGMGWPGGWSDADPATQDRSRAPIVSALDNNIYLMELDQSLNTIRQQTGIETFEMVGMDACLMGHLEVFSALQPHARYAVASQETEPALGWAYTGFLSGLVQNPDMDGAELSRIIVDSYIQNDQRIVDDQARSDYLRSGSPLGGLYSANRVTAGQLAQQLGRDVTLTAADLSAIPDLNQRLNDLSVALQSEDQSTVAGARDYAQSFTNIFSRERAAPYIDLANFIAVLKKEGLGAKASQAADQVLAGIQQVVLAEKHGSGKPGAEGISIYFPNSTLYRSPVAGPQSYTAVAQRFAQESLWDDFLAFHYNDIRIDPSSRTGVIPGANAVGRAPGAGNIDISTIRLSAKTAAPKKPVKLSADIKGNNIGYIYLFVGFYDQAANSIYVADTDYLESSETREVNGIYYPVWRKNKTFTMSLNWEPTVFAIDDGQTQAVALFNPQEYGGTAQEAVYTVDGIYTYADSGDQRRARLYFRDGELRQVFGFDGSEEAGAPWEITPKPGDTFTILEKWMDVDASGKVQSSAYQEGKTLTFGRQMFKMTELYAAAGNYVVGFLVQDLDGNAQESYAQITVR